METSPFGLYDKQEEKYYYVVAFNVDGNGLVYLASEEFEPLTVSWDTFNSVVNELKESDRYEKAWVDMEEDMDADREVASRPQ